MLKFVTLYMCTLFFQATLVSELNRFEAELDSDIRGLERKLSLKQQQPQRRGRGEVLTLPQTHSDPPKPPFFIHFTSLICVLVYTDTQDFLQ